MNKDSPLETLNSDKDSTMKTLSRNEANVTDSANTNVEGSNKCEERTSDKFESLADVSAEPPQYVALRLQFSLPASCYATSALREVLIDDSSYSAQKRLNQEFSDKAEQGQKRKMNDGSDEHDDVKKGHVEGYSIERGHRGRGKHNRHNRNHGKHRGGNRNRGRGRGRGRHNRHNRNHGKHR